MTDTGKIQGLTTEEANKRLKIYGKNCITPPPEEPSKSY
jgi:hypothetical protein